MSRVLVRNWAVTRGDLIKLDGVTQDGVRMSAMAYQNHVGAIGRLSTSTTTTSAPSAINRVRCDFPIENVDEIDDPNPLNCFSPLGSNCFLWSQSQFGTER